MNTVVMTSTATESYAPTDRLRQEKPPVPAVPKAWMQAS